MRIVGCESRPGQLHPGNARDRPAGMVLSVIISSNDVAFVRSTDLLRWYRWALGRKAADEWLMSRLAAELVKRQIL